MGLKQPDISAIIVAHREGLMAGLSLRSLLDCVKDAESSGLAVEKFVLLDRADEATRRIFEDTTVHGATVIETDLGDQGLVRNEAVRRTSGKTVAFLDGDDLWGLNWLRTAWSMFTHHGEKAIIHPEFNLFFHGNRNVLIKTDQTDPFFDVEFLRFGNYWDSLCLAPRAAYAQTPFCVTDVEAGYAYEDWHWNCETIASGFVHRVALGTIHFKRRRAWSQSIWAGRRDCIPRMTALFSYDWYHGETAGLQKERA